jgi:uroporphyrinogen-III synthase
LVTRAKKQASDLTGRLDALGAVPIVLPSIEIAPTGQPDLLDDALGNLRRYDWVVLTSVNGVSAVVERMDALGVDRSELAKRKLAVIGPATGRALSEAVREPDLVPDRYVAEAILDGLPDVTGMKFLLARADLARKELAAGLLDRGAIVDEVEAYRIVRTTEGDSEILDGPVPDVLTFTSSSGVKNTFERLRTAGRESWMSEAPIVCIGPVTADTVRDLGFEVAEMAEEFTIPGLVTAVEKYVARTQRGVHA